MHEIDLDQLPDYFKQKVSDDKIVELADKLLNGPLSFKDFITYRGAFFSICCQLLAYRHRCGEPVVYCECSACKDPEPITCEVCGAPKESLYIACSECGDDPRC